MGNYLTKYKMRKKVNCNNQVPMTKYLIVTNKIMNDLIRETASNIRAIRNKIEMENLDEATYPLHSFRYDAVGISELLKDLDECSTT